MLHHRRVQKKVLCLFFAPLFFGCQNLRHRGSENSTEPKDVLDSRNYPLEQPLVDPKYKLQQAEGPLETPTELDEKSFFRELFNDPQREPSKIRETFDKAVRKKRDLFKKDKDKQRLEFSNRERRLRQETLKRFELERQEFKKRRSSKEETRDFFQNQDERRKLFFAEERDARSEFESEMRDRQRNFEDYIKDKINEFNFQFRGFVRKKKEFEGIK